jgi:hypothetical protein
MCSEGVHCYCVYAELSALKTFGIKNVSAGIPLLRIASASPRSFVKSFEQRDALGLRTNSQMLSGCQTPL